MTNDEVNGALRDSLCAAARLAHERRRSARKGKNAKQIEIAEALCTDIDRALHRVDILEMSEPCVFKSYAELMSDK